MDTVRETAKAKVNLDLRVLRRREDGYHDLDSLVVFTDIGDQLAMTPADDLVLSIEGPFADALAYEPDNLILKATRRLASFLGRSPDVRIILEKRLPVASGLGGGSADAAATLRGLIRLWDLPLTIGDLTPLAQSLGADVPVCLGSRPARMTGMGEQLTPFDLPEPLAMLLINPETPIETPSVFKMLGHMSGERATLATSKSSFLEALKASANDLEAPAKCLAPVIGKVLAALADQPGCHLTRLSGSCATCFGLFQDHRSLADAENRLRADHPDWWMAACRCK
ncbi:MAG: 4-(cytidine 5'-diphospho)-2-C-methyl-D-erythritol kinase [Geminicoccaceae bacterium]